MELSVKDLSRSYGKTEVLSSVNFKAGPGELIALVGTNGADKTTLLKCLATFLHPDKGIVQIDGEELCRQRLDLRSRLHFLSDQPKIIGRTAIDHICTSVHLYERPLSGLKQQIVSWLRQFDMLECAEKSFVSLSRGQKYKTALIGLLAANPELWLLDEPFAAGVDPPGLSAMKRSIYKALGQGRIIIYSTQIVEIAEQFSDRVLVLNSSKLAADIPTEQLKQSETDNPLARVFEHLRISK